MVRKKWEVKLTVKATEEWKALMSEHTFAFDVHFLTFDMQKKKKKKKKGGELLHQICKF